MALAFVPVLAALVLDAIRERREAATSVRARLVRFVENAEREQRSLLVAGARALSVWGRTPAVRDGAPAACEAALTQLVRVNPEFVFPTRISARGVVVCGGTGPEAVGRDVSGNPLFPVVMASDTAIVGEYLRSQVLAEPLMPLNLAVRSADGAPAGVLSLGIRMRWLSDLATRSDLPEGGVITLVDDRGQVIARLPDDEHFTGQVLPSGYTSTQLRLGRLGGVEDGVSFDNVPRAIAFAQLPSPPGRRVGVSVSVPLASLTRAADARFARRLAVFAFALLATGLVGWAATGVLLSRDVRAVAAAATRIGTGDFAVRTGVGRGAREIRQLADAVDAMAAQLGEREARALQAQKLESLGRLAGGIAHDFNNLLTAIVGNVEDVRDDQAPGSLSRESLDAALDATRRGAALTKQLLTFARRDAVPALPAAVAPIVHDLVRLLQRTLGESITVHVDVDGDPAALVDRARLEQALLNLALNARDAMPQGGRLTIRVLRADREAPPGAAPEDGWVRVDVADTGTGMTPEVQARLFEPFFTTKPVGQGSGLGLAMVYATMQQVGGAVTVRTATGAGTVVTLWLRAAAAPAPTHAPAASPGRAAGRVLLAEDEPSVRTLAVRVLTRAGFTVTDAPDGASALARLRADGAEAFDVLVTDLVMPGMGGVALATSARELRPDLPVVLMTGYAGTEAPAALLDTPHTTLLEKPFDLGGLLAAVARVR
jgi:signal transduction histidine kinase